MHGDSNIKWEMICKQVPLAIWGYYHGTKPKTRRKATELLRIIGVLAQIRNGYLQKSKLQCYRYRKLSGIVSKSV